MNGALVDGRRVEPARYVLDSCLTSDLCRKRVPKRSIGVSAPGQSWATVRQAATIRWYW